MGLFTLHNCCVSCSLEYLSWTISFKCWLKLKRSMVESCPRGSTISLIYRALYELSCAGNSGNVDIEIKAQSLLISQWNHTLKRSAIDLDINNTRVPSTENVCIISILCRSTDYFNFSLISHYDHTGIALIYGSSFDPKI